MREIDRSTLLKLSRLRLREARGLIELGLFSGAYYLAGYAVELRLKALISGKFRTGQIPDPKFVANIFSHSVRNLVELAGLADALKASLDTIPEFAANWALVSDWNEQSRYRLNDESKARALVAAIETRHTGVLAWIATHSST